MGQGNSSGGVNGSLGGDSPVGESNTLENRGGDGTGGYWKVSVDDASGMERSPAETRMSSKRITFDPEVLGTSDMNFGCSTAGPFWESTEPPLGRL